MLPHSKYPCNDKIEQTIEEERIRQLLNADLNSKCCGTGINRSELGATEYIKQYIMKDKEKWTDYQKQYQQQYRNENKANLAEKMKQKIECECGCILQKWNLSKHKKTKKHQNWIQSQIKDK